MATINDLTALSHALVDMDGVLYHGTAAVPGAREFLQFLREIGVSFLLLTNNSTITVPQYVAKLAGMGIEASGESILTSAVATASYLSRTARPGARVFLIGENGIRQALLEQGFQLADSVDVDFVVVGLDRSVNYDKLSVAARAIRAGAAFVATNPDKTFPSEVGLVPGAGAFLAALEAATGVAPLVIGKPQPAIFEQALKRLGAETRTTAVVGDGLQTDVAGGLRLGLFTILIMGGVTSAEQLDKSAVEPDLVFEDIARLHRAWLGVSRLNHS